MLDHARASDSMCLVIDSLRADAAERGYEDWLRSDERLAGWDAWRIERPLRGTTPPFAALHFRYLSGPDELARLPIPLDTALLVARVAAP